MKNTGLASFTAIMALPDYINGTDTITSTDLIRRLWLDNYFYGGIFSLQYQKNKTQLHLVADGMNMMENIMTL